RGLVVMGFGVDGVTIMDELVGGGEWWCSGYIPKLERNLISLETLEKERYTVNLQSGKVKEGITSQEVIDYFYSDLCGPSQVESLRGKRYAVRVGLLDIFGKSQQKLAEQINKCLMDKGVKGYMLYRLNNESPNIVTSRIAIFNKSVMYKGTLKDSGAGTDKSVEELQVKVELWGLNNRTLEKDLKIIASEDSPKWKSNMKEEMDSMRKNKTSELLDYPAEQTLESYKWLFKIKE
nr:hypothetical protein [Tanacetum cinerariifolium]